MTRRRHAFTLIELLVVMAIIAVLVGLLLPAVQRAREAAYRIECKNNMRMFGVGCQLHMATLGYLPPCGRFGQPALSPAIPPGRSTRYYTADAQADLSPQLPIVGKYQQWSWQYQLLPYIEQDNLWRQNQQAGNTAQTDSQIVASPVKILACPSRRIASPRQVGPNQVFMSDYVMNGGTTDPGTTIPPTYPTNTVLFNGLAQPLIVQGGQVSIQTVSLSQVPDGLSNTVLFGEKYVPSTIDGINDVGDQDGAFSWFNPDTVRFALMQPRQDDSTTNAQVAQAVSNPQVGNFAAYPFGAAHPAAMNVAMCDGSVRVMRYSVDLQVFRYGCGRNDKQSFNIDDF